MLDFPRTWRMTHFLQKGIVLINGHDDIFLGKKVKFQILIIIGIVHQGQICLSVFQPIEHLLMRTFLYGQGDMRKPLSKVGKQGRQHDAAAPFCQGQGHVAEKSFPKFGKFLLELPFLCADFLYITLVNNTGLRQCQWITIPGEELHTQVFLQPFEIFAQGGLRQIQFVGGF